MAWGSGQELRQSDSRGILGLGFTTASLGVQESMFWNSVGPVEGSLEQFTLKVRPTRAVRFLIAQDQRFRDQIDRVGEIAFNGIGGKVD